MNQLVPIMWKNVLYTVWFLDFVTVFKESYNCQTSHYLGRNRLPNACLVVLSYLVFGLLQRLQLTYVWPIIFKWPYFKHLWAKNIFSHSSCVKIICLESFSQMSISIFVLCWTGSNKSTMGFIHKNATILIFVLSKMWDLYAFML